MTIYRLIPISLCISFAGLLSSCGTSPPARLYLLEPVAVSSQASLSSFTTILVNEVSLAEHLARKEILSRNQHYQVSAASFDRWAESLESNITSVLAANLSVLIASASVISHPWTVGENAEFTVSVQVLSFGPDPSGDVTLTAVWRIAAAGGETVAQRRARYSQSRATNEPVETVASMSQVLADLSKDIATALQTVSSTSVSERRDVRSKL
jgi:uncharacterized lipoprotein YmbA